VVFGIGTLLGGYGGHWVTKNYYQAQEALQIKRELKNQEIHRREVEDILEKQEALEQLVRDLEREADSDPTAKSPALPRRGVQRINRVR
jgi:hypothetical protein